jgi:hypothetical protein
VSSGPLKIPIAVYSRAPSKCEEDVGKQKNGKSVFWTNLILMPGWEVNKTLLCEGERKVGTSMVLQGLKEKLLNSLDLRAESVSGKSP